MIKRGQVVDLLELMNIESGYVISQSIFKGDRIDVTEYGLGCDEMISFEKSANDKLYIALKGKLKIRTKTDDICEYALDPFQMFYVEKEQYREISGAKDYAFLMLTLRSDMMIKHLEKELVFNLSDQVPYQENKIVSKTISNNEGLIMTLFAFDGEQEISTHSAPGDALVIALDGAADITIDGKLYSVKKGESIIMPANVPHAVKVSEHYQMLLIVSK